MTATDSSKVLKAGDTMTGALTMSGASADIISGSSITTSGTFFGNGSGLTNVTATDSSKVLKAGDTMTGALTMSGASANVISGSSITTTGSFYGDGSNLTGVIQSSATGTYGISITGKAGSVTNGVYTNAANTITGSLTMSGASANIVSQSSITTSGSMLANDATFTNAVTASSGTFTASGSSQYSIETSSGIKVNAGSVDVADMVTAAKLVVANATTSRFHVPVLSTANLLTVTPADVGDLYYNSNLNALCVSTGTATFAIVESSSPATPCQ